MRLRMKGGMSLLELVVAMSVMTFVVGIVIGLMMEVSQGWKRLSDYWMWVRPAQSVLSQLCVELESVCFYDLRQNRFLEFSIQQQNSLLDGADMMRSCEFFKHAGSGDLEYVKYSLRRGKDAIDCEECACKNYALYREGMDYALLEGIVYFRIQPMLRSGNPALNDAVPDWFDVEMRICDTQRNSIQHIFRRRVIIMTRL